jgi:hypothetical protein
VEEQLVESKRGLGMFINAGARKLLLQAERQKFLAEEWPRVHATIQRLGLKTEELLNGAGGADRRSSSDTASSKTAPSNAATSDVVEPEAAPSKTETKEE